MSDTDSFIDEVSEEVRRDRLFAIMRRYGWIAALAIVALVGGAAYVEYTKARDRAAAEAYGDGLIAALEQEAPEARLDGLGAIDPANAQGRAVLEMLRASQQVEAGDMQGAAETLNALAAREDVPQIYRQIAEYKALGLPDTGLAPQERRAALEALASTAAPLRLLAQEQIALLDLDAGETEAALELLQRITADAEVTPGLRRRATQVIVTLGGTPAEDRSAAQASPVSQ